MPYKIKKTNLQSIKKTKVDIMMNLGDPTQAFKYSFLPNQGVGLARLEFIITSLYKNSSLGAYELSKITA